MSSHHTPTDHCENCGSTSAEDISNLSDTEGYTRCCNELTCDGRGRRGFGERDGAHTYTCCWAMAEREGIHEGCRFD